MLDHIPINIEILAAIFGAVLSSIVTFYIGRKKNNTDSFKALIEANQQFREEVRTDLRITKEELKESLEIIEIKDKLIKTLKEQVDGLEEDISILKEHNQIYKDTLNCCETEEDTSNEHKKI